MSPGRRRRAVTAASATALVAGLGLALAGMWIPAKAALAQVLLDSAWSRAQAGELAPRPWPWADLTPLARLSVPSTGDTLLVLDDASGRSLAFGPGHLPDTAAPGAHGNTVIAGHRDTQFGFLEGIAPGSELRMEDRAGRLHRYRVAGARVAHEAEAWVTRPTRADTLTLVTCWPFGAVQPGTEWRYVVTARRVVDEEAERARGSTPPRQLALRLLR